VKKFVCIILVLYFSSNIGRAQNFILNPSYELVDTAFIQSTNIIDGAFYWKSLVPSPDLLSPLHQGSLNYYGAPNNTYGYQYSYNKNNYSFIQNEIFWYHNREFFSQTFPDTLESGRQYCLSMWVSSPDSQQYCSDCLEAYFSVGLPDTTGTGGGYLINFTPQVSYFTGSVFCDTVNWQHVTASFTAAGGENTITIGCFKKDEDVITQTLNPYWKFGTGYYIDGIALYSCDAPVFEADAGADTNICIGQSVVLGSHNMPQYEYLWLSEEGDTLSREAFFAVQPTTTTTYTLHVTDFKFDITTDDITVRVDECNFPLYVANIFSPNADGNNDLLCVRGRQISGLEEFRVFNRWGEEVYTCHAERSRSVTPEDCCWDGNIAGEEAPAGVYTWYAKAIMLSGQTVSGHGNVTLVR